MTMTNNTFGGRDLSLHGAQFRDELLAFTAPATVLRGTVLGRVTATGRLTPWSAAAFDGSQVAVALVPSDVVATGAGDVAIRALIAGEVARSRLVIAADGNGNNITAALIDQLRNIGITVIDVAPLGDSAVA
ncbi:MAG: Bacteriophage lambda head decoration protein [Pseudomonadota bacterium]|jgi:hypothetical protein